MRCPRPGRCSPPAAIFPGDGGKNYCSGGFVRVMGTRSACLAMSSCHANVSRSPAAIRICNCPRSIRNRAVNRVQPAIAYFTPENKLRLSISPEFHGYGDCVSRLAAPKCHVGISHLRRARKNSGSLTVEGASSITFVAPLHRTFRVPPADIQMLPVMLSPSQNLNFDCAGAVEVLFPCTCATSRSVGCFRSGIEPTQNQVH